MFTCPPAPGRGACVSTYVHSLSFARPSKIFWRGVSKCVRAQTFAASPFLLRIDPEVQKTGRGVRSYRYNGNA
jgi:hypothetical protein